ncbi:BREX system ATP-binding protein BrxD [Mesorhizobium sp. P16.1]|uniref:BREX system ATP-binding protein BrxD n=1 Tax=unclassified Mesorhizobium TaxID=325217 RepID=UPI0021A773EB|nr:MULTISPECIES: BREX system ATP-binding protein BrxD [unclassified Mesorhizobium]MCT2580891.1 BREX system ATP-binding protein BrxD [Mesorhizobium sp. P13.3]MDF3169970.1 BREX system ATP-binding protein BrxD [Mesorhizobium sp. P16.1]MDF3181302.1 BREX system ATP-binding protein BrxD [Mesorhizobium sp. P17.1]MDF3186849.1 BREX system ATP-binding protein BrxD [Mesorhizobium sp. ICCV3110.1]
MIGAQRRSAILDALRRGTVPHDGLGAFAVGMERFEAAFTADLSAVAGGRGGFKAVRGEYGSGKTFMARWLQERARAEGFATSEVQISETETPLHRWETVYRRLVERLATADTPEGALRPTVDAWFYTLEEDILAEGSVAADDANALATATEVLMERRLAAIARTAPAFSAVLRAYRRALLADEPALAEGLLAWLGGQPNVAAAVKRAAGVKGDLDSFGAMHFLAGLLTILRDSGRAGLVLVLDEAETLQRMRADTREKGLNALRQFLDELDAGRYPGLYLVVTGTAAFFDGPQGVQRLPPLAQRLHTDFATDSRFDNPRAVQVRLQGFNLDALSTVGRRVRDIFAEHATDSERIRATVNDDYVADLARGVAGRLGGRIGVAPRLFLRKLVAEVLDRVDQFADFDPRRHYAPTIDEREMTKAERAAASATDVDDLEFDS